MGRIADSVDDPEPSPAWVYSNIIDDILERECEDNDDRRVVLSWLTSPSISNRGVMLRLRSHDIEVSSSSVGNWRAAQRDGIGREWAA